MSWIFLSILAALIWSVVNIFDKYIISKLVEKPIVPVIVMGTIGLIASAAISIFHGFQPLSTISIILAIIAGIFYVLMTFLSHPAFYSDYCRVFSRRNFYTP